MNNTIAMLIVFEMGIQNTFGRHYAKATYAPTTVMTGNVTQATLDLANIVLSPTVDPAKRNSFKKLLLTIFAFLTGCTLGSILAGLLGLFVVTVPGAVITVLFYRSLSLKK